MKTEMTPEEFNREIERIDELIKNSGSFIETTQSDFNELRKIVPDDVFQVIQPFVNHVLFIALNGLDLIIGIKNLVYATHYAKPLEKAYHARMLALSCWSTLEKLTGTLSKDTKAHIKKEFGVATLASIQKHLSELDELRKQHYGMLEEIRHNTVGHKLRDATKQAEIIRSIEAKVIHDIAVKIVLAQAQVIGKVTSALAENGRKGRFL